MLGPILVNLLAISRWVGGSPQYYRPSYRHDYDLDTSRQGDYTIRGYLYRPDDSLGYQDGRSYYSRQYPGYRRSYDGYYGRTGETCPYQNEKLSRKKREAGSEGSNSSLLLTRLRRQSPYRRRYYDDDSYYGRSYYSRQYPGYRRSYDSYYGRAGYDNCGREICDWEAELVCPLRVDSRRIVWTREHDAYYPRDKYRDIIHYCAGRCDPEGDVLRIRKVKPEDKGVYRCYIEGGDERDFKVVQFQPKFPLELNSNGIDC